MSEHWESLIRSDAFIPLGEAMEEVSSKDFESSLSVKEWNRLTHVNESLVGAHLAHVAIFKSLIVPFTAETKFRPYQPKNIRPNIDIELDLEDRRKLNGVVPAHFVLNQELVSPIVGRNRYGARLIPPYPSQAPELVVQRSLDESQRRKKAIAERALRNHNYIAGYFEVEREEFPQGTSIQAVSEDRHVTRKGRVALYVMSPRDYDRIEPEGTTYFRYTRLLSADGKPKPMIWNEGSKHFAIAVNALKPTDKAPNPRQMIVV
jgi:hypothetical protein